MDSVSALFSHIVNWFSGLSAVAADPMVATVMANARSNVEPVLRQPVQGTVIVLAGWLVLQSIIPRDHAGIVLWLLVISVTVTSLLFGHGITQWWATLLAHLRS